MFQGGMMLSPCFVLSTHLQGRGFLYPTHFVLFFLENSTYAINIHVSGNAFIYRNKAWWRVWNVLAGNLAFCETL